ncbi:MAG: DedA family protein [Gammaproteobacteria bacterium]|nr:DedA family protein [Gammaproteobacteria bacterium]
MLVEFVLHLDTHLAAFIAQYGIWVYALLFAIIFSETGFVVTPFLPGDSLLFVAGTLAAAGDMNIHLLALLLFIAAFSGNQLNFQIGRWLGPKVFRDGSQSRLLKREYLDRTRAFFARHGGKTIVMSRFIPIVRTYAPFVAGLSQMPYPRFIGYNLVGALSWIGLLLYAGYFFGNLPVVRENLGAVIIGIVVLSLLPIVVEHLRPQRTD